jgi:hypothetical protein
MFTSGPARVKSSPNTRNLTDVAEIKKCDRIVTTLNEQNHALSLQAVP